MKVKVTIRKKRMANFRRAIAEYADNDAESNLIDLLADALHWSNANKVDFAESLAMAYIHFMAESTNGGRP